MKWVVGALVAVGLVLASAYGLLRAESGTSTDEAGNTVIHFGALPIPVTDDEPLEGRPPIFRGDLANAEPQFDVEPLGDDLSFVMGEPHRSGLEAMGGDQDIFGLFGRAVYLGDDVQGSPVYLFQQTGPSIVDIVKGWFTNVETTGIFGSSYNCCASQSQEGSAPVRNQPNLGFMEVGDQSYAVAEMWAIQEDVAVVSFVDENDQALGWQRPVSGYVGVRFETDSGSRGFPNIRMIAYDSDGNVVEEASWALPAQG
jgi:hypothetical protein